MSEGVSEGVSEAADRQGERRHNGMDQVEKCRMYKGLAVGEAQ